MPVANLRLCLLLHALTIAQQIVYDESLSNKHPTRVITVAKQALKSRCWSAECVVFDAFLIGTDLLFDGLAVKMSGLRRWMYSGGYSVYTIHHVLDAFFQALCLIPGFSGFPLDLVEFNTQFSQNGLHFCPAESVHFPTALAHCFRMVVNEHRVMIDMFSGRITARGALTQSTQGSNGLMELASRALDS